MSLAAAFDKQDGSGLGHDLVLVIGAAAFSCAVLAAGLQKLNAWANTPAHVAAIALIALLTCLLTYETFQMFKLRVSPKDAQALRAIMREKDSVFCGTSLVGSQVFIKPRQRAMHTQVIGTTNAGKTESVILPWAIQDIEQGRGLILIDGKADRSLLDKLYAYSVKYGREKDFRLFSLSSVEDSHQFNPLVGGTPEEVSERVFNSFEFEDPYYRSVQFEIFSNVMRILSSANETPTFLRIHQGITKPKALVTLASLGGDLALKHWAEWFRDLPPNERSQRTSGLVAALSHFAFGSSAILFNTEEPAITIEKALKDNLIVYFQLPVLLSPFLGKATGKLILQCLQSAVANRHRAADRSPHFYSVFLDDFSEYLYPGFVSILNKSRSANVGIVFAHQALGDIKTLGDAIANSILTNANLKVFMRGNDPDSAEYFAKVIGTVTTTKFTERTRRSFWRQEGTGDKSAREADEFIIHPNHFKSGMGVGKGVIVIPHESGCSSLEVSFKKYDDLEPLALPRIEKQEAAQLRTLEK
jgi:hypothetical protein